MTKIMSSEEKIIVILYMEVKDFFCAKMIINYHIV